MLIADQEKKERRKLISNNISVTNYLIYFRLLGVTSMSVARKKEHL